MHLPSFKCLGMCHVCSYGIELKFFFMLDTSAQTNAFKVSRHFHTDRRIAVLSDWAFEKRQLVECYYACLFYMKLTKDWGQPRTVSRWIVAQYSSNSWKVPEKASKEDCGKGIAYPKITIYLTQLIVPHAILMTPDTLWEALLRTLKSWKSRNKLICNSWKEVLCRHQYSLVVSLFLVFRSNVTRSQVGYYCFFSALKRNIMLKLKESEKWWCSKLYRGPRA